MNVNKNESSFQLNICLVGIIQVLVALTNLLKQGDWELSIIASKSGGSFNERFDTIRSTDEVFEIASL